MFNFFSRPRHIPVTPITTHRIRCGPPRTVPPLPGASPYPQFPPPPRKRYGAGVGPHRVDLRSLRPQKSLKARRSGQGKAARPKRTRSSSPTFERLSDEVYNAVRSTPAAVNHDHEDEIFLRQLSHLNFTHDFKKELAAARDLVARSAEAAPALKKAREEKISREKEARERRAERKRMDADLKKQPLVKERVEKRRRKTTRLLSKNAHRTPRERPQPVCPSVEPLANRLARYDHQWNALINEDCERREPIPFDQVPWPVLPHITSPDQITDSAVQEFIFHPLRAFKSPKDRLNVELLKWHPDKFDPRILPKVMVEQVDIVRKAAGDVAKILTEMKNKVEAA